METYLKVNGYSMSIWITTTANIKNKEKNRKDYESFVKDEHGIIIAKFRHKNLKDRIFWAKGFFKGKEYVPQMKY